MSIEILSERRYGEPKLPTPKELKGIKKIGTVRFMGGTNKGAACPVYVTKTHIYLKHRDWFSPCISFAKAKEAGILDNIRQKFVYDDNFGGVILRCEAWLRMPLLIITRWRGLLPEYGLLMEMARTLGKTELQLDEGGDWSRMFGDLIKLCKPYLPKRPKLQTFSSLLDMP